MPFWGVYSYFYDLCLRNLFPYQRLLEDLNHALEIRNAETILDAGCGPGSVTERVVRENLGKGIVVLGLDSSAGMLKRARKKCRNLPDVSFRLADLNKNLELHDGAFDRVLCSNTLYALEDPERVVSELYRVLRPGGKVIIANPKPNAGLKELLRDHLRALRRLTPLRRKIYRVLLSISLIPAHLVVVVVNRIIIDRAKGRRYHFLGEESLRRVLQGAGFKNINIASCYADQNWLAKGEK